LKVIVFGAGTSGRKYIENCAEDIEIVAVADNNWSNIRMIFGHRVISADTALQTEYDRVVITIEYRTQKGIDSIFSIRNQLMESGVPDSKIVLASDLDAGNEAPAHKYPRVQFLQSFASSVNDDMEGAVAECGVCWGDFASQINECFSSRKLYLFDTFEGFPDSDMSPESSEVQGELRRNNEVIGNTISPELTLLKCPHKENVIIRKGYVPDTLYEFENERFLFVNLDMDMYAPTISALRFFADKMVANGVILVHDYLERYGGVVEAVDEFASEIPIKKLPIGDGASIAIIING